MSRRAGQGGRLSKGLKVGCLSPAGDFHMQGTGSAKDLGQVCVSGAWRTVTRPGGEQKGLV